MLADRVRMGSIQKVESGGEYLLDYGFLFSRAMGVVGSSKKVPIDLVLDNLPLYFEVVFEYGKASETETKMLFEMEDGTEIDSISMFSIMGWGNTTVTPHILTMTDMINMKLSHDANMTRIHIYSPYMTKMKGIINIRRNNISGEIIGVVPFDEDIEW